MDTRNRQEKTLDDILYKLDEISKKLGSQQVNLEEPKGARCDICGKEFSTKNGLKMHKVKAHGIHL